ncbi:MAG: lysophospholipase [Clostridia bacterium]|nr:lysophospholipase [Clostridia bacterium]
MEKPAWRIEKERLVERYRTENRQAVKGQIVFAGSSLMEMFPVQSWAEELGPDAPMVYNRGIGGYRTDDMLPILDVCVTDLMPRRLFINIGTNDLSDASVTIDALIGRYDRILSSIEERVPGVDIILMAYYPINYNAADEGMKACLRIRTNERIREANRAVEALAQRRGHRYIDFNAPLTDAQGRLKAEYTIEGMHITPEGYRAIWPEVAKYILEP